MTQSEELAITEKRLEKIIEKNISRCMENKQNLPLPQAYQEKKNTPYPVINVRPSIDYDIVKEAKHSSGMTCGGWTFFANEKEGKHLWAVNKDGTEYCELYGKTISRVSKIEDGFVFFRDADYRILKVNIQNGKVETASSEITAGPIRSRPHRN